MMNDSHHNYCLKAYVDSILCLCVLCYKHRLVVGLVDNMAFLVTNSHFCIEAVLLAKLGQISWIW